MKKPPKPIAEDPPAVCFESAALIRLAAELAELSLEHPSDIFDAMTARGWRLDLITEEYYRP